MKRDAKEPRLEAGPVESEAGPGWLLWVSLCGAFVFTLVLLSGEVDRRASAAGLALSLALLAYERRRVGNAFRWSSNLGTGCAGGFVLAGAVGKLLDVTGVMEVWDRRDQLTLSGMVLLWALMFVGMGLVARWGPVRPTPSDDV